MGSNRGYRTASEEARDMFSSPKKWPESRLRVWQCEITGWLLAAGVVADLIGWHKLSTSPLGAYVLLALAFWGMAAIWQKIREMEKKL